MEQKETYGRGGGAAGWSRGDSSADLGGAAACYAERLRFELTFKMISIIVFCLNVRRAHRSYVPVPELVCTPNKFSREQREQRQLLI